MRLELEDEAGLIATLRAGLVPQDILHSPARVHRERGRLSLEPRRRLPAAVRRGLEAAGVTVEAGRLEAPVAEVASWLEAVRATPAELPPLPLGEVIFVTPPGEGFVDLSRELLRLGAPTQQIAAFEDEAGRPRSMVRVTAPPYYVALRAMEADSGLTAFTPQVGRVWTALGARHPLADAAQVEPGRLLLVPRDGPWRALPDGPWASLDAHLDLRWPEDRRLAVAATEARLSVELRLEPSSRPAEARLWVLREGGAAAVEALLAELPSAVAEALQFCRLEGPEGRLTVLRSPDLGAPPPALDLAAEAYAPRRDLSNLYVPVGAALAPPLTTEQLRARLAPDLDELVWVVPGSRLRLERAPEAAFQRLEAWVDYVIEQAAAPLEAWVRGALFDFEAFVEAAPTPAPAGAAPERARRASRARSVASPPPLAPAPRARAPAPVAPLELRSISVAPSDAEARAQALERAMITDPPVDATRAERWAELGAALAAAGRPVDVGLAFARASLAAEAPGPVCAAWAAQVDLPGVSGLSSALSAEGRAAPLAVAAHLAAALHAGRILERGAAERWLARHEGGLPVHAVWLLRVALARAAGGDPLGLLRTRDGIAGRIEEGLSLARDVPSFVRHIDDEEAGAPVARLLERLDALWATYLGLERKRSWNEAPEPLTRAYVGLLVRWGRARLGAPADPEDGLAPAALDAADPVHGALLRLFEARTAQAREGRELSAPVPPEVRAAVEALPAFERFKVERLWLGSRALGGSDAQDAFRRWASQGSAAPIPEDVEGRERALEALLAGPPDEDRAHRVAALLAGVPEASAAPRVSAALAWARGLEPAARLGCGEALVQLAGQLDRAELVREAFDAMGEDLAADPRRAAAVLGRAARVFTRAGLGPILRDAVAAAQRETTGDDVADVEARLGLAAAMAGLQDKAAAVRELERAQAVLLAPLESQARLRLVRAMALALARTSAEQAAGGVEALTPLLAEVTDKFSTNSHFCVSVLHFFESLVLALTGRDLTIGEAARRWLDDDEDRLRARIHHDLEEPPR